MNDINDKQTTDDALKANAQSTTNERKADAAQDVKPDSAADEQKASTAKSTEDSAKPEKNSKDDSVFNAVDLPPVAISRKGNRGSGFFIWLIFFIAIAAAITAGYLAWLKYQDIKASELDMVSRDVKNNQMTIKGLEDALGQANREVRALKSNSDKRIADLLNEQVQMQEAMQKTLANNQAVLDAQSRRLRLLTATTTDDWRLAEVEYLLRLANQRILTSNDSESALSLLRSSDAILLELNNPSLFAVREAIADDRAALAMLAKQDIEGIFLALSAMIKQVDALPMIDLPGFSTESEKTVEASVSTEDDVLSVESMYEKLMSMMKASFSEVRSWIVVQSQDADIKPLLPPEQQYYLKNNLRLMLNQAQLAALDARQAVYSDTLQNATQWLDDYFPKDQSAVEAMKTELLALSQRKVYVELPDVSASLLAIKAYIAEQHNLKKGDIKPRSGEDVKEN